MSGRLILGCDPGQSGALAWLDPDDSSLVFVVSARTTETAEGKKVLDGYDLAHWAQIWAPDTKEAWIEDVHAMPGQGVTSTFNFGKAYGMFLGILQANNVPIRYVRPAVWKGKMGLSADKEKSAALASRLFPASARYWKLKKHHDRAEAALIAKYGSMQK